jgi:hypothetical protein
MSAKKKDDTAERVAQLERELAEVKAAQPKPQKSWEQMERELREWENEMHQLREARMAHAIHPATVRDLAGGVTDADCRDIVRASHAPTGPSAMSPSTPPVTAGGRPANVPGSGTGWAHSAPLGPPPGVAQADRLMDAQDAKDRAELIRQEAQQRAMQKLEALHDQLTEQKK